MSYNRLGRKCNIQPPERRVGRKREEQRRDEGHRRVKLGSSGIPETVSWIAATLSVLATRLMSKYR